MTDSVESKLSPSLEVAHVLFVDIVGYSALPMEEQQSFLAQLQTSIRATAEFASSELNHRLICLPTGDGMALVFFGDPVAPIRCALELSRELRAHPEVKLRMGINSGPVYRVSDINANLNVAGGGINVAQRVMDCGDAGHILVSQSVADVLNQLSQWKSSLSDLGEITAKHGTRIRVFNLLANGLGNKNIPKKILASASPQNQVLAKKLSWPVLIGGIAVVIIASFWLPFFNTKKAHALTEKDTVVLADITNKTGDPVFDESLREGLSVQLEQSPFLALVSEDQMHETLRFMAQPPDTMVTPEIGREICLRTNSAAVLGGSISQIGSRYQLVLRAVNCSTGETLASTEAWASDKNQVVDMLGTEASEIRRKLGESVRTVERLNLLEASTPSIEALKAYSDGRNADDYKASILLFHQAIAIDSNFAMAYAGLATTYFIHGETALGAENMKRAYELRAHASQRERFFIEARYFEFVTGDLEKALQVYEAWVQTYPRDSSPSGLSQGIYRELGQYDRALAQGPSVSDLISLNRLNEAHAMVKVEQSKGSPYSTFDLYRIAFLEQDNATMKEQAEKSAGKPGFEDTFLDFEASTAAYSGQLTRSRELSERAIVSNERAGQKERAADYESSAATVEALFGDFARARGAAHATLSLSTAPDAQYGAALALAFSQDAPQAQKLTEDLIARFPQNTIVQSIYVPTIQGLIGLDNGDASQSIETLRTALPYELGNAANLYPAYVRGTAYLAERKGQEAATEFQKIVDHSGIVGNDPIGALAHLGIARSFSQQGETAKARAAYEEFLALWKDADPDIPVFKQAKLEYAKLQ